MSGRDGGLEPAANRVVLACAALSGLIGGSVLLGWAADIAVLKSVNPGWVAMQPWSAVAYLFAAGALALEGRGRAALQAGLLVLLVALVGLMLGEYLSGVAFGIDDLLFGRAVKAQPLLFPGRMAELPTLEFLLFATVMVLYRWPSAGGVAAASASIGLLIASVSVLGYVFGAHRLARLGSYTAVAVHSGLAMALLFFGQLVAKHRSNWLHQLVSPRRGGVMARRTLPAVLLFPLVVGGVVSRLGGDFDLQPGHRMAVAMVAVMFGLIAATVWAAHQLNEAEKRAEAGEANFRAIYEQAAVGIKLVDLDGRVFDFNQKLCDLLGFSRAELRAANIDALTDPRDLAVERRLVEEMLAGRRQSYDVEKRLRCKDGRIVWVRVAASLQMSPEGPCSRICVVEDITAQKEALAALQAAKDQAEAAMASAAESALRFRTLADNIPQLAWMAHPDGAIFWFNQRWFGYTGASWEQVQGWGWQAVHPPDEVERVVARVKQNFDAGEPWEDTFLIRSRTGEYRWFLTRARPVRDEGGQVLLWFGTNTDVTEQRRQEADLTQAKEEAERAKEAAERANRDKSRFLAAASHDLRQPVQALVLFTAVLWQRLKSQPSAQQIVQSMRASLDALQKLLDGLLDVSRLDAGVIVPDLHTFAVGDLIRRVGGEYRTRAAEKGLELRLVPCRCPVSSDPVLVERILRNLVENAIRYTESGGIVVGSRHRAGQVLLQVVDSGIGIPADQQETVFQEFYQVGNPERDRAKGLGLGLSIVRRLCRLLELPLTLESRPGRGTCFSLALPMAEAVEPEVQAPTPAVERPAVGAGSQALVIDDEAMIRLGLTVLLEGWGWQVAACADGQEAAEWVAGSGQCPDVILADYRLRDGVVGTDAVRQVQAACGREIPAVIITGDTSPERIAEIKASGFGIAHKPIAPEYLRQLVGGAIERHRAN